MKNADYFKHKKITVVGFGRSGLACANLLSDLGAQVSITDNQDNPATRSNAAKLKPGIKSELGLHSRDFIKERDLVVVSPGVADTSGPIIWAKAAGIPILSEIEVGWRLCPAEVVAITGTNGKTTVTTLIGEILAAAGKKVFICGNIGNPFCREVSKMQRGDFVSLEVSSFQLEYIHTFKPKIALILNLSLNHLDRYRNMQDYLEAKKRIFRHQDQGDYLILNQGDPLVSDLAKEARAKVVYFSQGQGLNSNHAAALAATSLLGIDKDLALRVFREFKGVEHRLENVAKINQVTFINDSKATTVDATLWALKNISAPVILIAGGREKGNDYRLLLDLARKKLKAAVLIGEAKDKISAVLADFLPVNRANSLEEAVNLAFSKAAAGDCVLLSPMCKSFDMFQDYEDRGRAFKKIVQDLLKKES